jgi:hypothetical protein
MPTHVANVEIQSSEIGSDLADFRFDIDLSDLPAAFWDSVSDGGGDIRVYKSDGTTQLPRKVFSCDTSTNTGGFGSGTPATCHLQPTPPYRYTLTAAA